ncbi:Exosome complex component RRP45 [Aphelenchoides besseyi]|nr:Exosome complex component RRP45 [Aphelenchoides besseyi]KAI6195285.1 Exosome complex component RRP45 [Aphelenchoides besseyi]
MRIRNYLSEPERIFLTDSLTEGVRLDGRGMLEQRKLKIQSIANGRCISGTLGNTRIDCTIQVDPVAARTTGRPTSGFLYFDVRKTATARFGSAFKTKDPPRELDRVQPILNRLYKDARAIELDSLCIEAYHCVYKVRVQVNVVQEDGNLIDCATAVVAVALSVVKRRAVEYDPNTRLLRFLTNEESVPSNIPMNFLALTTTFSFLNEDSKPMKDANAREYKVCSHSITVGMNHRDELIVVFATGRSLTVELMDQLMTLAKTQCAENAEVVKAVVGKFAKIDSQ